jgi:glutaredoxin
MNDTFIVLSQKACPICDVAKKLIDAEGDYAEQHNAGKHMDYYLSKSKKPCKWRNAGPVDSHGVPVLTVGLKSKLTENNDALPVMYHVESGQYFNYDELKEHYNEG